MVTINFSSTLEKEENKLTIWKLVIKSQKCYKINGALIKSKSQAGDISRLVSYFLEKLLSYVRQKERNACNFNLMHGR